MKHSNCKYTEHRSTCRFKIYAALFFCMTTRTVHIKVVHDLTTEALIQALIRLISRRGLPKKMFSDNGTTEFSKSMMKNYNRSPLMSILNSLLYLLALQILAVSGRLHLSRPRNILLSSSRIRS